MRKCHYIMLGLAIIPTTIFADGIPSFSAEYATHKGALKLASSKISLVNNGGKFSYKSESEPAGIVSVLSSDVLTEVSDGSFEGGSQVRPTRYEFAHMKGSKRKKHRAVTFDWSKNVAHTINKDGSNSDVPIKAGTIDEFSLRLALMLDLKAKRADLSYEAIDNGKLKPFKFMIEGEEQVKSAIGKFRTIKVKRERENSSRVTYMWCAPDLAYLPIKMQHIETDGSTMLMTITKLQGLR